MISSSVLHLYSIHTLRGLNWTRWVKNNSWELLVGHEKSCLKLSGKGACSKQLIMNLKYSSVQAKDECCTQVMLTEHKNRRDNMREAANKKWCNPFYFKVTQFQALTGRTLFDFGKLTFKFQTGCWEISFICNKAFCFLKTLSTEAMIAIKLWTPCRQGISYVMQRNLNKSYYKINQHLTTSRHHRSLVAHLAQNLHLNT